MGEALDGLEAATGKAFELPQGDGWLEALAERAEALAAAEGRLSAWCAWLRARDEASATGLAPLVEAIDRGEVAAGSAAAAFELGYARWWLDATVERDEALKRFAVAEHESRLELFRELDERHREATKDLIRARLAAGLPSRDTIDRGNELGLLRRELEKKKRHLPVRELIKRLPSSLTRLTPCLMMSPLSIAQYLPADAALFDLVVFDEASQITVCDAVGALARGKRSVVVGDPKQLPPTSFFGRRDSEADEELEVEQDLESILDEALGANIPKLDLAWHYRSRHESLIAFSNQRYYGGGLVTFPSADVADKAVRHVHVPQGVYAKGGGRNNEGEAKAVVAELVGRLRDPAFKREGLSSAWSPSTPSSSG